MVVDWAAIGFDGPPIRGEPGAISNLSSDLAGVADSIDEQISRLNAVDADAIWDSQASPYFKEAKADLPDLLGKVSSRYRSAGEVFDTYSSDLGGAVSDMNYWGTRAVEAKAALDAAQQSLDTQRQQEADARSQLDQWNRDNPDQRRTAPPSELGSYQNAVGAARDDFDLALQKIRGAVDAKNEAGGRAAEALGGINADALKNSSNPFKRFARWASDALNLPAWADILRFVASVVSVAALLLCWVPIVGPILGATALVLNVLLVLVDTILALSGQGSWGQVAWSAFGALTGGFGRAFSVGARAAQQGYRVARGAQSVRGLVTGTRLTFPAGVRARLMPATSPLRAFAANAKPWSNFPEVLDHIRIVRNGRNLPGTTLPLHSALGGHKPGYWNAFRANAGTHGRNLIGLGGPGAAAFVWGDVFRRVGLPTISGHSPNPVARWNDLQSHQQGGQPTPAPSPTP